jgi:hypothetical protein
MWRGAVTIRSIRVLDDLDEALAYYQKVHANRFYEVHSDREPHLISRKKVQQIISEKGMSGV